MDKIIVSTENNVKSDFEDYNYKYFLPKIATKKIPYADHATNSFDGQLHNLPKQVVYCKKCVVSNEDIHGECLVGEEVCLPNGEWPGECKQIILPGDKDEFCADRIDNDCDNKIDCLDTEACPNGAVCGESKQCINFQCVGI